MENWDEILIDLKTMSVRAVERKYDCYDGQVRKALVKAGLDNNGNIKEVVKEGKELVKGESTLYDEDGNIKLKWVKTHVKEQSALEAFSEALEALIDNPKVISPEEIKEPVVTDYETMSVYTIGDAHIGMLAWDKETGEDHDLEIAQRDLLRAMDLLVEQSHPSERALIVDVGDWFHSDNMNNVTAHSGNSLDVDGRYPKVLEIGLRLATKLIDRALLKHERVEWRSAIGNHNEHSAIMMSAFIKAWYRNEQRVIVHDTPNMFFYRPFGKNLIGITHGHTCKAEKLGEVMSVDCKDQWSASEHRYWYTGHIHHQSVKEFSNCVVETFRTLAGKDAWHSASGYRSKQDMKCITLHEEYGEISRNTVSLGMIRG
ncbi:MAG: oxidoreductase [Actinomycetia bacterium]|nr:oxidoreductase [Actinomycetes bacterium]